MAKQSAISSAHAHAQHCQHYMRDVHGRFRPEHGRSFPKRQENGRSSREPIPERTDFPSTGTPNTLHQAHQQEEEFERSEQIAAAEHVVPAGDASEWIDPDQSSG